MSLTFDVSVDLSESTDDAVSAVPLSDVNFCGEQSVAWLRVDQRNTHSRLGERYKHTYSLCMFKKATRGRNVVKLKLHIPTNHLSHN